MTLEYSGREEIPASRDAVWSFITKPENIASCMPDVQSSKVIDDRTFDATVRVAVGPVRGSFAFHVVLVPADDRASMGMKITGGGFGSVVDLDARAQLGDGVTAGPTVLDWRGTANMRGPVATVGGRVLDAQARRVIETTFANVKAKLSAPAAV